VPDGLYKENVDFRGQQNIPYEGKKNYGTLPKCMIQ
jgi:hypothetical protein